MKETDLLRVYNHVHPIQKVFISFNLDDLKTGLCK